MRAAQWSSVLFLFSMAFLAGIHLRTAGPTGAEDPAHPDRGSLSPLLDPPPRRVEIARVDPEFGQVIDLAANGDKLAILTRKGWVLHSEGSTTTWEGDRAPGAPGWVSRPMSIALGSSAVYVLDGGRSVISGWDETGERIPDLPLPIEATYAQRPTQLLLDPSGRPMVTVQRVERGGTASWDIFRYDPSGVREKVLSLPSQSRSMVFREPLLTLSDAALYSMDPLTHQLSRVDLDSARVVGLSARADPPLWHIPRRHRREYGRMLAGLGVEAARLSELPEFWPSVRDFSIRDDGTFVVAVTAGEDRQHIELLDGALSPIGRFNYDGFVEPLFLSQGRVFVVEEVMEGAVIYELVPEVG